ncbi:MAG: hypothetical protein CL930_08035 [Deltaproteobacteria bacterium]|nr:hypothetical protein [Deltaproteobacteria bacterium]
MTRILWIICVATACSGTEDTSQGTVVGNPGDTSMQLARSSAVDIVDATTFVDAFEWMDCNGTSSTVDVQSDVDLLGQNTVEGPSGEWCGLTIHLGDTLEIVTELAGEEESERFQLQFALDVEYLQLSAQDGFVVGGKSTVVEFGHPNWLDLEAIRWDDDEDGEDCEEAEEIMEELWEACEDGDGDACDELDEVSEWYDANCEEDDFGDEGEDSVLIDEDSSSHDRLVRGFMFGSALYEDDDSDGRVSDDERSSGSMAVGSEHPDFVTEDEATDDVDTNRSSEFGADGDLEVGGCGRNESNLAWLLLPFAVFRLRRPNQ